MLGFVYQSQLSSWGNMIGWGISKGDAMHKVNDMINMLLGFQSGRFSKIILIVREEGF